MSEHYSWQAGLVPRAGHKDKLCLAWRSAVSEPVMHVKVYAPFKTYFDGDAASLSAVNGTGPFDILPHHKNFMSLLVPCTITVRAPKEDDFNLKVTRGVMHVKSDKVTVFLDV